VPDDLVLPPAQALEEAQRLLDGGMPFHAHEVLEAVWKAAPDGERDLWQGLAQLAVGLTHRLRGNRVGATSVLQRGGRRIARYAADPPYRIDVQGLLAWIDRTTSDDAATPAPPRLLR
jgi:predicted metal-dependent hydrolase